MKKINVAILSLIFLPYFNVCMEPLSNERQKPSKLRDVRFGEYGFKYLQDYREEAALIHDSEFHKLESAQKAKDHQTDGFEGCRNKKICKYNGFYAATYSPEGLCSTCEFKQYPERFIACAFCRRPAKNTGIYYRSICYGKCSNGIQELLVKLLKVNDEWKHKQALIMGAFNYIEKSHEHISKNYIANFGDTDTYFNTFPNEFPGIYKGVVLLENGKKHIWSKALTIDPQDKKLVTTWADGEALLKYICEKYKIFGPETGHVIDNPSELPNDTVSYEEKT